MMSPTCRNVLAALWLWSIIALPCYGVRDDNVIRLKLQGSYNIELIVTRHALSCANIISDFEMADVEKPAESSRKSNFFRLYNTISSKVTKGTRHRGIADPILSEVGMKGSRDMRIDQALKLDAVLTSPLLRAIETAILQYPSKALHIVPHIREMSALSMLSEGADNLPTPLEDQGKRLKEILGAQLVEKINFTDWTTPDGPKKRTGDHDWTKFKIFLATEFLPDLIPKLNKPSGSNITLAVVTHSNFMKGVKDIYKDCGHYWSALGKPYNNQAVRISYNASTLSTVDDQQEESVTKEKLVMKQNPGCTQVARGVLYKGQKLCLRDIGDICQRDIKKQSLELPKLLDTQLNAELEVKESQIKSIEEKILALETQFKAKLEAKQDEIKRLEDEIQTWETQFNATLKATQDEIKRIEEKIVKESQALSGKDLEQQATAFKFVVQPLNKQLKEVTAQGEKQKLPTYREEYFQTYVQPLKDKLKALIDEGEKQKLPEFHQQFFRTHVQPLKDQIKKLDEVVQKLPSTFTCINGQTLDS